jgi:hypothetical protein
MHKKAFNVSQWWFWKTMSQVVGNMHNILPALHDLVK